MLPKAPWDKVVKGPLLVEIKAENRHAFSKTLIVNAMRKASFRKKYSCNLCVRIPKLFTFARTKMVDLAQLVRVTDCGSDGRGFESHIPPQNRKIKHKS